MWTDRLVTIFLAAIAALLTAYFFQPAGMRSATAGTITTGLKTGTSTGLKTGANTVYDVRLVQSISTPGVKSVVPLAWTSTGDTNAATFAITSSDHVYVYHVNHFSTTE